METYKQLMPVILKKAAKLLITTRLLDWDRLGLNQRLLPCQGSTLPLSYDPMRKIPYDNSAFLSRGKTKQQLLRY